MIEGIPLLGIGQSGLLALVFILVLTDKLVWHQRLKKRDAQITALTEQVNELTRQQGVLLDSAIPTVNATLTALRQAAEREQR